MLDLNPIDKNPVPICPLYSIYAILGLNTLGNIILEQKAIQHVKSQHLNR